MTTPPFSTSPRFQPGFRGWTYVLDDHDQYVPRPVELLYGPDANGMYVVLKDNGVTDRTGVLMATREEMLAFLKVTDEPVHHEPESPEYVQVSAQQAPAGQISITLPQGWRVVPTKVTPDMIRAAEAVLQGSDVARIEAVIEAAIAGAPSLRGVVTQ